MKNRAGTEKVETIGPRTQLEAMWDALRSMHEKHEAIRSESSRFAAWATYMNAKRGRRQAKR